MKKQRQKLKPEKVTRLSNIFESKKWVKETVTGVNEFDDFCTMLEYMDETQQNLILNLTDDFLQVASTQQIAYLVESYKVLVSTDMSTYSNIIISPLLTPEDKNKIKSSVFLFHNLQKEIQLFEKLSGNIKLKLIDNYDKLFKEDISSDTLICLIDDYIGSGETAIKAINYLMNNNIPVLNICILPLVTQHEACLRLDQIKVPVYCSKIRYKGITDNKRFSETDKNTMHSIEGKMHVKEKYQFGYKQTEGLVRFERTPNNTFPVYWYPSSTSVPVVPFRRERKFTNGQ